MESKNKKHLFKRILPGKAYVTRDQITFLGLFITYIPTL